MNIGIIGAGNMAGAIARGLVSKGFAADKIMLSDPDESKLALFREKSFKTGTNIETAINSDVLIMAIKPNNYENVLTEIKPYINHQLIISIAAGISISYIKSILGNRHVIRIMPNTPALVGLAMIAVSYEDPVTEEEVETANSIFEALGKYVYIPEALMDAAVSVSGSGPAYIFMFIDAMAKSGERMGLDRKDALLMAAQTVLGSAEMVLKTDTDPDALKTMVCSPGGTTIEAVKVFEEGNLYQLVESAMTACMEKSKQLKK